MTGKAAPASAPEKKFAAGTEPTDADLALNAASEWIGPVRHHRLLDRFGSAGAALRSGEQGLAGAGLSPAQVRALLQHCSSFDVRSERAALLRKGRFALRFDAPAYPSRLREAPMPPPWLYIEGSLPPEGAPVVAVVGTRRPTPYGRRMARSLAAGLARAGVWVVSGLARGVDMEAHEACLDAGGRTLAVLGSGLDRVWPTEHQPLARRMAASGGGLLSQFSLAAPPLKQHFPMRNAVISGLSLGVVVVEGARGSGSMITANAALEQGREVFAVPGPADAPESAGPLDLIRDGACLVRGAEDILEALGLPAASVLPRVPPEGLGAATSRLWRSLPDSGGLDPAALGMAAGLDAADLAAALTELELKGLIRRGAGGQFIAL